MGKLINMMQSNLFGRKKQLDANSDGSGAATEAISTTYSITHVEYANTGMKTNEADDITKISSPDNHSRLTGSGCYNTVDVNEGVDIRKDAYTDIRSVLEGYTTDHEKQQDNIEEKLYELERCYLFEQNNMIDKYELEREEMLSKHAEEKLFAKRAFEHEKDELLKEMERKDKILYELTNIMKEEYTNKLSKQKEEYIKEMERKDIRYSSLELNLKLLFDRLESFFRNNKGVTEGVEEFKQIRLEYDTLTESLASEKLKSNDVLWTGTKVGEGVGGEEDRFGNDSFSCIHRLKRQFSDPNYSSTIATPPSPPPLPTTQNTFDKGNLNTKREQVVVKKPVTRTLSDNVRLVTTTNDCCRKHHSRCNNDEAIQHELAQAYRKQKSELLKLFNSEKEQFEKTINAGKDLFERETREEYVNRMSVERKAWQETIEDLEREVAILKYERQQMDSNYCVGMDKMKTEFEREKNAIHRRYNESFIQLKKGVEEKARNERIIEEKMANQ